MVLMSCAPDRPKVVSKAGRKQGGPRPVDPVAQSVASGPAREPGVVSQAKHRLAADMLREIRLSAEALSANADRLLSRFS